MARFLAIDWDHKQLHLVAATTGKASLTVTRALIENEDQNPNLATAEMLGQRLRDILKEQKIAPGPVVACVGRDRVILKEILYPPVPAQDEPAVVRFQALKELTHPPEEVVIDYFPTGESGPQGERRALVLVLRKELLTTYQELCKAAGLKLAGLMPRSFGTAACLQRCLTASGMVPAEVADAPAAVLTVAGQWAEFCVVHRGNLLFARALAAPAPGAEAALMGEIRRNLAVYAGQAPHTPVRALFLADGGGHTALRDLLQNTLAIPVHPLDPFLGAAEPAMPADRRGAFAGAVGALHAHASGRVPINFAVPKQPQKARDPNKLRWVVAAGLAGLLVIGGAVAGYVQLASLDTQIESLSAIRSGLDTQLATLEVEEKRFKAISDWVENDVVVLDELYDLTERFPDVESVRLTQLSIEPLARGTGKQRYISRVSLKGIATNESQKLDTLQVHLVEDNHYQVGPLNRTRNTQVDRFRFPIAFSTQINLEPRSPHDYKLVLKATAPERPEPGGGNAEPGGLGGFGGFGGFGGMGGQP